MPDIAQPTRPGVPGASRIREVATNVFAPEVAVTTGLGQGLPVQYLTRSVLTGTAVNAAATGATADLDVTTVVELGIDVFLATLTGGVTPQVAVFLSRKTLQGRYVRLGPIGTAMTTVGESRSVDAGSLLGNGPDVIVRSLGRTVRLEWETTGTPTTLTLDLSVYGT